MKRKIDPKNREEIIVIRTRCEANFLERQETGEKIQYTIRILPGFLIPHSRVPVPEIFKAFDAYLKNDNTQQQAALFMNCDSRHSFRLYFSRLSNLIGQWISHLQTTLTLQIQIENKMDDKKEEISGIKKKWIQVGTIIGAINIGKEAESWISINTHRFEYAHTILVGCRMGLGP